jgi:tetrahedral aminopeptidase
MGLLENLINIDGVSGDEDEIRNFLVKNSKKHFKDVKVDNMGNVVVHKKGKKPSILLLSHMDEVGLMVKSINKQGKIFISTIGGIDPAILIGQRVFIKTGKDRMRGVITTDDVLDSADVTGKVKIGDLFVFTGLSKKDLLKSGVEVGNYVVFGEGYHCCDVGGKNAGIISGKALDDRIGCYILLELMKNLKTKNEIYFIFTVQEEVGLYGAKASVFNVEPDYAIAVDVTAYDSLGETLQLGKGPVLTIKDAEMLSHKCLNEALKDSAKRRRVKLQLEVSESGTTDATSIFAAKGGIPSSVMGVSVANLHTTISVASRKDIKETIEVLKDFVKKPPMKCWSWKDK